MAWTVITREVGIDETIVQVGPNRIAAHIVTEEIHRGALGRTRYTVRVSGSRFRVTGERSLQGRTLTLPPEHRDQIAEHLVGEDVLAAALSTATVGDTR